MEEHINNFLNPFGITITSEDAEALITYIDCILRWNKAKRIVGKQGFHEILEDLILDSILPAIWLKDSPCLLDIGSGAGIPGIPLKIVLKDLELILVEPIIKKATFLKWVTRELRLSHVNVVMKRIQDVQSVDLPFQLDTAISRALSDPVALIKTLIKLPLNIKYMILYTSWRYDAEGSLQDAIKPFHLKYSLNYTIPHAKKRRLILLEYKP